MTKQLFSTIKCVGGHLHEHGWILISFLQEKTAVQSTMTIVFTHSQTLPLSKRRF